MRRACLPIVARYGRRNVLQAAAVMICDSERGAT